MPKDNKLIISEIKRVYGIKSDADFARFLGIPATTLANWYTRNSINYELLYSKCERINPEFLLTGKGRVEKQGMDELTVIATPNVLNAKLVSQYAYAGYLSGFTDAEYVDTLPTVPFIVPEGQTARGQYLAFEVRGDSMDDGSADSIVETDIVLGRLIQPHHYINSKLHFRKWFFIIVHESDGILIKQITAHDVERKTIVIHSLNEIYPDRELHLSEVKQLFNVVQMLRKTRPIA